MASEYFPRMGSMLPQTCSSGTSLLARSPSFMRSFAVAAGIVGVDAGNLVGVGGGPGVGVFAAPAHADEGRLLGQPVLFGEEGVPGVPLLARLQRGVGRDVGDVKTALEQFDFGLRLVVPVTASPGPRIAGGRLLRNDHDAPPLALRRVLDAELFSFRRLERLDGQGRLVHHEVVAVEARARPSSRPRRPWGLPVPAALLAPLLWRTVSFQRGPTRQ